MLDATLLRSFRSALRGLDCAVTVAGRAQMEQVGAARGFFIEHVLHTHSADKSAAGRCVCVCDIAAMTPPPIFLAMFVFLFFVAAQTTGFGVRPTRSSYATNASFRARARFSVTVSFAFTSSSSISCLNARPGWWQWRNMVKSWQWVW
jgi:hypothetical protein